MFVVVFMLLVAAGVFVSMPVELVFIPADGTALLISAPAGGVVFMAGGCSAVALVD